MNIFKRFGEPSSQAGIAAIVTAAATAAPAFGVPVEKVQGIAAALAAIFGGLAVIIPERRSDKKPGG